MLGRKYSRKESKKKKDICADLKYLLYKMLNAYLPGLDFIMVVILEDAFVAQAQPPRYPLLVLGHQKKHG